MYVTLLNYIYYIKVLCFQQGLKKKFGGGTWDERLKFSVKPAMLTSTKITKEMYNYCIIYSLYFNYNRCFRGCLYETWLAGIQSGVK